MSSIFDLSGRVAVVIGATSGLGRSIAVGLAKYGADVAPTARRQELIEAVCREVESEGRQTLAHPVDVLDRDSINVFRNAVVNKFGVVDILVYAAGVTSRKPAAEVAEADWSGIFDSNLNGALRCAQSFHSPLKATGRGRVIHIASLGSYLAFSGVSAYCASKSALLSLTRSLACEWARDGICVNALVPGIFPTEMNAHLIQGTPRGEELLMRTPMARFGDPRELVGAAVLLASDGASFITGQSIVVDGGYLASGVNT
jgi:NAD(P)-dependent dehydrogenase (short-subunit alcohol dehydrogenase family)